MFSLVGALPRLSCSWNHSSGSLCCIMYLSAPALSQITSKHHDTIQVGKKRHIMICKTINFSIHLATQAPANHKRSNKLNEIEIWQTHAWITDNFAPSGINLGKRFHFSQNMLAGCRKSWSINAWCKNDRMLSESELWAKHLQKEWGRLARWLAHLV